MKKTREEILAEIFATNEQDDTPINEIGEIENSKTREEDIDISRNAIAEDELNRRDKIMYSALTSILYRQDMTNEILEDMYEHLSFFRKVLTISLIISGACLCLTMIVALIM